MVDKEPKKLAYRLFRGVACYNERGRLQLVLSYPLKTISLHRTWRTVLERLSSDTFVPLDSLAPLIHGAHPDEVELFLNDLSRKGFLEQEGFSTLSDHPFVSVIIPVRNRPLEIEACLRSLGEVVYPLEKIEIIVVDDASTDHTPETVSRFPVRLIRLDKNQQAPYCRNLAGRTAKGNILAFLDSDCLVDSHWLEELVPAFRDSTVGAIGGMVAGCFEETPLDRYEAVKSSLIMGSRIRRTTDYDRAFYVPSCNLLVKRDLFLRLGGFREELLVGEDVDFCWRLQDEGYHLEFNPAGKVFHKHRNRLRPFCARRFDYGTSEPLLQQLHRKRSKEMLFPVGGTLFWGMAALGGIFQSPFLVALCCAILTMDTLNKWRRVRRWCIPVGFFSILISVARGYTAFFYHCCAFLSRYYLIWCIPLLPLSPFAGVAILGIHFLAGCIEYVMKRPRLDPFSFLFYFTCEQVSYQLGVWWGCLRQLAFGAINPRVIRRTPQNNI